MRKGIHVQGNKKRNTGKKKLKRILWMWRIYTVFFLKENTMHTIHIHIRSNVIPNRIQTTDIDDSVGGHHRSQMLIGLATKGYTIRNLINLHNKFREIPQEWMGVDNGPTNFLSCESAFFSFWGVFVCNARYSLIKILNRNLLLAHQENLIFLSNESLSCALNMISYSILYDNEYNRRNREFQLWMFIMMVGKSVDCFQWPFLLPLCGSAQAK